MTMDDVELLALLYAINGCGVLLQAPSALSGAAYGNELYRVYV